jgi:hypothetical protein
MARDEPLVWVQLATREELSKGVDWVVVARCGTRSISLGANPSRDR